jgi:hypothetical protein
MSKKTPAEIISFIEQLDRAAKTQLWIGFLDRPDLRPGILPVPENVFQMLYDLACLAICLPESPKGRPGRPGYPLEARRYARELRRQNPHMKTQAILNKCLEKFAPDDLPPEVDSFRRWLNRPRKNN